MAKRRRGARSAARPSAAIAASRGSSTGPSRPSRCRSPCAGRGGHRHRGRSVAGPAARERLGPDDTLYGLYEGVPRTEWSADWIATPNRITLFRLPLEEDFPDPEDLADEVRITVIHELAHHLGIDDDRLDELGVG